MNIETKEALSDQHFWNMVFLAVSVAVFVVSMTFLGTEASDALVGMTPFQFIILSFATFRLTRLLAADHIMLWLRDACVNVSETTDPETGMLCVVREKPPKGVRLLFANLLGCPWCIGVWMSFFVLILYIGVALNIFPLGRVIIYVFAIAGAASLWQTLIGALRAERASDGFTAKRSSASSWNSQERRGNPNVCTDCGLK